MSGEGAGLVDGAVGVGPEGPAIGLYGAIFRRRDVRAQFTGEPIPADVLRRMLEAAHAAPSVGLTQPWDFVLVTYDGWNESNRTTNREDDHEQW
ncbi:MAG TPA: nitroreductase family protein [Acidimicrobiales bacterium]|jgi:hypothetical protein|nr:nitroreductase family protein [Acidimicrobiales bacterium]